MSSAQAMDPLAGLRDLHTPGMIESWPPAPGWWLLAAMTAALVAYGFFLLARYWRSNLYRREALAELARLKTEWQMHGDNRIWLAALQSLLKRVALTGFPREEVASLTGEAWVQFLDRTSGSQEFSLTDALIDGSYREDMVVDVAMLERFADFWIRKHQLRSVKGSLTETSE